MNKWNSKTLFKKWIRICAIKKELKTNETKDYIKNRDTFLSMKLGLTYFDPLLTTKNQNNQSKSAQPTFEKSRFLKHLIWSKLKPGCTVLDSDLHGWMRKKECPPPTSNPPTIRELKSIDFFQLASVVVIVNSCGWKSIRSGSLVEFDFSEFFEDNQMVIDSF